MMACSGRRASTSAPISPSCGLPLPEPTTLNAPEAIPPFDTGLLLRDLREDRAVLVHAPFGSVAVVLSEERIRCFQAFCPHMEGPLFEGSLANGEVVCPWHSWRFRLADGCRVDGTGPDMQTLSAFVDEGSRVFIQPPPAGTELP